MDNPPYFSSVPSHPPPPPQAPTSTERKDYRKEPSKNKFGLACLRCRSRKVKCDGRREGGCLNCARKSFECVFDVQPKRRGPDKLPGRKRRTAAQKQQDIADGVDVKAAKPRPSSSSSSSQRNSQPHQQHPHQSFDLSTSGLQRISPQSSSAGSPSHENGQSYQAVGAGAGPSKRRKSVGVVKTERAEDEEGFSIRPGSSHHQGGGAGGGRPLDQDRAHDGSGSRGSSVSSTGSSVFAHQPQQGYPSNLPPHHFQLQPPLQQFDFTHGFHNPAAVGSLHHHSLQNQTQHHHQLPPLPSLSQFSHSSYPSSSPGLPLDPSAGHHFPSYFTQNRNHHPNAILDQHQQQQPSHPHHSHLPHQPQPPHQLHHYAPHPDPFLPYHNDHHSNPNGPPPPPGRSYTLPFPQNSHHQHQHETVPRLQAPSYPSTNHAYQNSSSNQDQNGRDGRVDSNSRPASASTQSQPPRPGTATSSSTKGKRRASDADLDEEDEYEEYEDYEDGEEDALGSREHSDDDEEEEDVKPDLGEQQHQQQLLNQQQQHQDQQQVFQVRGGGIVTVSQNDPENGARIWEQGEGKGGLELSMMSSSMMGNTAHTARHLSRPSTACSRPSSASSAMISTPPLPSPHQQTLPVATVQMLTLPKAPNADYPRQIWWDFLLSQFGRNRETAYATVVSQLAHLFKVSNHWLAFINIPLFVAKLHHPVHRQNLQPALVYSMLALSSHMSSWDGHGGRGFEGRLLGLKFKEQALTAFWNSWNSGWIDAGLAKAAFLMAVYEVSAHPLQSDQRSASAMLLLDNVMRTLALPSLDVNDPNANMFPEGQIPEIRSLTGSGVAPMVSYSNLGLHSEQSTTNCPFWTACPRWSNPRDPTSVQEIEKDETRRLVWSASALAASFSMFRYSVGLESVDLYIGNPENFALLYPGENLFVGSGQDGKSSIWSLYATTAMLWHFALRHHLSDASEEDKRNQAVKVWTVSRSLEAMFDQAKKKVAGDTNMDWYEKIGSLAYDWQSRDWLLSSRMLVSDSFSRFIPDASSHEVINDFHVASARHWLYTQSGVAKSLNPANQSQVMSDDARSLINHRPVWIFWFMQQLSRAMQLYELNPEFTEALTVVREDLAPMLQFLLNLYPSEGLFDSLNAIISRLNEANRQASFPEVVLHFPAVLNGEEVRTLMAQQPLLGETD